MNATSKSTISSFGADGRFGQYGRRFVPETLTAALEELEHAYKDASADSSFQSRLRGLLHNYVGRPTPLYHALNLEKHINGPRIFIKREDLAHTGAHKINNALGQALLAKHIGKTRIIAETGAGQHGVAVATVCALLGMKCIVYMGELDIARQAPNVDRMKLLGASIKPVISGSRTLKDAVNEAIRDWITNVEDTYYLIGSAVGPHPYPFMVRNFQSVIGYEARKQCLDQAGNLPDYVIACVGGGSNAIGIFRGFIDDENVRLIGVEAGGMGLTTDLHGATLSAGSPGVLHGSLSYLLQDEYGQVKEAHSISAGLDYPGVGPEHAYLHDTGRAEYATATDDEALDAFEIITRCEGILPALEPCHAVAYILKEAASWRKDETVLLLMSGRGDKDMETVIKARGISV